MIDDSLSGEEVAELAGVEKPTVRAWVSQGKLHPTKRDGKYGPENRYDLEDVRRLMIELKDPDAVDILDELIADRVNAPDVTQDIDTQPYTTAVNFHLVGGVAGRARRLLPAPPAPPKTSPAPDLAQNRATVTASSPKSAPAPNLAQNRPPDAATAPKPAPAPNLAQNRPPAAAIPTKPAPAPATPAMMGPRAAKRAREELGCWKAFMVLVWAAGFACLVLTGIIARLKGLW